MLQLEFEKYLEAELLLPGRTSVFVSTGLQLIVWGPPTLWQIICFTQSLLI